jgi:type IV secretion system protein VirB1
MKVLDAITVMVALLVCAPLPAGAQLPVRSLAFETLAAECAPDVHPTTLKGLISTESAWNPYAIGVVSGHLDRQPRSLAEAIATARELERQGFNFSMGLGQINRYNLSRYGETYETVFEPCRNLKAGGAILTDCFRRARALFSDDQQALRAAFSCYYSGNFTRGFRPGKGGQPSYVQKVVANATAQAQPIPVVPAVKHENPDGVVTVRPADRAPAPVRQATTAAQWVIFADGQQQGVPPAVQAGEQRDVKVQRVTPAAQAKPATVALHAGHGEDGRNAPANPTQRATSYSAQDDAPFVQFAN